MMTQALELTRRPHVIVATPGRLADHIRSSSDVVNLKRLRYLVSKKMISIRFMADIINRKSE